MKNTKHIGSEHNEDAIDPTTDSYTSSKLSDENSNDIEKRAEGNETGVGGVPREDDAVTAKTWAVVIVS